MILRFLHVLPWLLPALLLGQETIGVDPGELPRIPPTEPAEALATFEVEPGFRLVLAAHEPAVTDPIAMAFDERGRAWVIEMRGYSERREEALGRIRVLADTDGDGVFDKSTVFKDGLKWPTAIACYKGGVFVGATPDLLYLRDGDGDGVADEERVVFTGFGGGKLRLNMQALFNSLRWGPDNRIWGATAANGGSVTRPDDPGFGPVELRGADFSFDPEQLDLRPENGTAQYGMSFDSRGRRFVCSNSRHLIWVAWERGHLRSNPWYSPPPPLVNIPDDGAAAPVFRISPDEPWRIVRTRWRVAGVVKGIVEGGGRVSGYFTSATGVHLYWGDAFGDGYRDNAFIGDVGSNLVHRKVVQEPAGSIQPVGSRPEPGETTEFLRSRDNWFRPTSFATGPDGCLYITDMYREVIEHPWSLPEPIKKHLDLNSGFERGRIYRMEPEGFTRVPAPDLAELEDDALRELLEHPGDWYRTTARRLLYERGRPSAPASTVDPFPALLAADEPLFDRIEAAREDRWIRAAFLNSLRTPDDLAAAWSAMGEDSDGDLAIGLAGMIGRSGDEALLARVVGEIAEEPVGPSLAQLVEALLGKSTALSDGVRSSLDGIVSRARETLADASASSATRLSAIRLLSRLGGTGGQETLRSMLLSKPPSDLAPGLVEAISDVSFLVDHFDDLPSAALSGLGNRILGQAPASERLLVRLREEEIELAEVPASVVEGLRRHSSEAVQALASEVLPEPRSRLDVIAEYRDSLELEGDPGRGHAAFAKACVSCHLSHKGEGIELGPAISTFATAGGESLLERILDPNREVAPQYQAYVFERKDGSSLTGMILRETPEDVTVRMPGGIDQTFPRVSVTSMRGLGQSLMPEGLETSLTKQEMADLLAYLAAPDAE